MPGAFFRQFVQVELKLFGKILRANYQLVVMARGNGYPRAITDRRRHNKAIVVVGVLADEIHPARRLKDARRRLKKLGKSFCQPLNLIVDLWITAMHGKLTLTK
jgi:hypothetical protein